jgi:hypothetical protein
MCAGCGAYAPDIAPVISHGRTVPSYSAAEPADLVPSDAVEPGRPGLPDTRPGSDSHRLGSAAEAGGGSDADETSSAGPAGGPEGMEPAPMGRAARRRQRARWKKNQRRAVVATAFALVGGGLTVASMDRQSNHGAQTNASPELPATSAVEEQTAQESRQPEKQPLSTHRSSSATRSSAPDDRRRGAGALPGTARRDIRPDSTAPRSAADPGPRTGSPSSYGTDPDRGGTAVKPTPAPPSGENADPKAPGSSADSKPGNSDASGNPDTPEAVSAPTETSPSELCVLVVCLG